LFQPELFVRSTKASLGDVLADPGTTMRAIATEMVAPTVAVHYLSIINVDKIMSKLTLDRAC